MEVQDTSEQSSLRPIERALIALRQELLEYVERYMPPPVRGLHDPADVVQDVCFEALRRESAYDPSADPTGRRWLLTLARRRLVRLLDRRLTSRQATQAAVAEDTDEPLGRLLEELAVYERTPSASAASHETWAAVQMAFGRLSAAHVAVIRAKYYDREPLVDYAARVGRSADAVHKLCQRANVLAPR